MKQQRTKSESVPGDKVGAAAGPQGASPWKLPLGTTAMKKRGTTLPHLDTLTLNLSRQRSFDRSLPRAVEISRHNYGMDDQTGFKTQYEWEKEKEKRLKNANFEANLGSIKAGKV